MKVAIFGATGGTGRIMIRKALDRGHEVTAAARNPSALLGGHRPSLAGWSDLLPSGLGCHRARRLLQHSESEAGPVRPGSRFLVDGVRCNAPHPGQPGP